MLSKTSEKLVYYAMYCTTQATYFKVNVSEVMSSTHMWFTVMLSTSLTQALLQNMQAIIVDCVREKLNLSWK